MEFPKYGFEAEIGNSRTTAEIILESLKSENWFDNETALIFIEQTYYNPNVKAFRIWIRNRIWSKQGGSTTPGTKLLGPIWSQEFSLFIY